MKRIALSAAVLLSSTAFAEVPSVIVTGGYESGSMDLTDKALNLSADADVSGMGFGAQLYLSDNLKVSLGMSSGEADITVLGESVTMDVDTTSFGAAYVFGGRVDYAEGTGTEHSVGLRHTKSDIEIAVANYKDDSTNTRIGYGITNGIGNGLTLMGNVDIDSEDFLDDLAYSVGVVKSMTPNIGIYGTFSGSKYSDGDLEGDSNSLTIGIAGAF